VRGLGVGSEVIGVRVGWEEGEIGGGGVCRKGLRWGSNVSGSRLGVEGYNRESEGKSGSIRMWG
jgi:hypothetical protein